MGYCQGLGSHRSRYRGGGGYEEGLSGPKRLAAMIRSGASPAAIDAERRAMRVRKLARKGAKLATGTGIQRLQFRMLTEKVAAGAATQKERRLVGGVIPTPETAPAIERVRRKRKRSGTADRQLREAAEAAAEANAAAQAARERQAAEAALAREQSAADAAARREQQAADREAERAIRADERQAETTRRAEDREIALEQAEFDRAMAAGAVEAGGVYTGGGGGSGAPWTVAAREAPGGGGLDMGKILPIAAGAALLFLGS